MNSLLIILLLTLVNSFQFNYFSLELQLVNKFPMSQCPSKYNVSISKVYADVLTNVPEEEWNYEKVNISWGSPQPYQIVSRIGRGKYSSVFKGIITEGLFPCAIKCLKPIKEDRFKREILVLQRLINGPNIIRLYDCVKEDITGTPSLVMEYIENTKFQFFYKKFTLQDTQYYLYELLKALKYAHSKGIMHRDIKPDNICYDLNTKKLRIIDWGLAEFYHPGKEYNVRVASRSYKSPELLLNMQQYDYSLDMWGFGCILGSLIFKKEPIFEGRDLDDQLLQIVQLFGTNELYIYITKYNCKVDSSLLFTLKNYSTSSFSKFINENNKNFCTVEALDLLEKVLVFDHQKRLSADEAMNHPFFKSLRNN
ncbi:protein kinase domain containing protein [Entamoeba nuttalli P19]|uniref:non-specific serine/threonine protein kinase n=2 Tax=Entamoeba nuttalli TaxID=412467 RepID=K2G7R1_ENTNP|nr:protein kinase domain containing protein [Entamoeba nuttalli P19]EKE38486.1 protein kinase domain containing protein [Entamoeba nuttalli P19]|eukprot:XP_008859167.1 protein kinase domain containing protein [Entamoeba nuttalli P19]